MQNRPSLQAARNAHAPVPGSRKAGRAVQVARRGVVLAAVWLVLAGTSLEAMLLGLGCVSLATWLSLRLMPEGAPIRLFPLIAMAPRFVLRSLIGGLDVARRALDPRLPINPGWLEIVTALPDGGRVALGGELSLMPGTLAAGSDGDRLLIHTLDLDQDVAGVVNDEARRFRRVLDRPETRQDDA